VDFRNVSPLYHIVYVSIFAFQLLQVQRIRHSPCPALTVLVSYLTGVYSLSANIALSPLRHIRFLCPAVDTCRKANQHQHNGVFTSLLCHDFPHTSFVASVLRQLRAQVSCKAARCDHAQHRVSAVRTQTLFKTHYASNDTKTKSNMGGITFQSHTSRDCCADGSWRGR